MRIGFRPLTADELRLGREFVTKWFPALANQPLVESKVCQREDSIDEHFIVNQHPELNNVWLVGVFALVGAIILERSGGYDLGAQLLNFGALIAFMGVNLAAFVHYFVRKRERTLGNALPPRLSCPRIAGTEAARSI